MREYICNVCGSEFLGSDNPEDAECTECYAMDCQVAYEDAEEAKMSKEKCPDCCGGGKVKKEVIPQYIKDVDCLSCNGTGQKQPEFKVGELVYDTITENFRTVKTYVFFGDKGSICREGEARYRVLSAYRRPTPSEFAKLHPTEYRLMQYMAETIGEACFKIGSLTDCRDDKCEKCFIYKAIQQFKDWKNK